MAYSSWLPHDRLLTKAVRLFTEASAVTQSVTHLISASTIRSSFQGGVIWPTRTLAAAVLVCLMFFSAFSAGSQTPEPHLPGAVLDQGNGAQLKITLPATGPVLAVIGTNSVMPITLKGKGVTSGVIIADDTDSDELAIFPGMGGNGPVLNCTGPETNVGCNIQMKGASGELFITSTVSPDFLGITDAFAPGSGPDLICGGPESSVSCSLQTKGYGKIFLFAFGNSANAQVGIGPYVFSGAYGGPIIDSEVANTPLLLSGGSGNGQVVAMSPLAETASVRNTSGSSYTVATGVGIVILDGVNATYTLIMPATPLNGQAVELECGSSVRTLTVSASSGQTMKGSATSCTTIQGHKWRYSAPAAAWYMLY